MNKILVYLFVAVIATYLLMAVAGMSYCMWTNLPACADDNIGKFLGEALAATLGLLVGSKDK